MTILEVFARGIPPEDDWTLESHPGDLFSILGRETSGFKSVQRRERASAESGSEANIPP